MRRLCFVSDDSIENGQAAFAAEIGRRYHHFEYAAAYRGRRKNILYYVGFIFISDSDLLKIFAGHFTLMMRRLIYSQLCFEYSRHAASAPLAISF